MPFYKNFYFLCLLSSAFGTEPLYHGSPVQHLTTLLPYKSTHGISLVYATEHLAVAASSLIRSNDFEFALSFDDDDVFCITERYPDAFNLFKNQSGSIYTLSRNGFTSTEFTWEGEVVSPIPTPILEELVISDSYEYLKQLETMGVLKLYHYPNRPTLIPEDDSDLIERALLWEKDFPEVIEQFLRLHPHLKEPFALKKALP